jgi:hypothetical protein
MGVTDNAMSFTLPTFNLTCNVWHNPAVPPGAASISPVCNLAWGKRFHVPTTAGGFGNTQLLLPPGTDIRCLAVQNCVVSDIVEVPAGSGRFYDVFSVDDAGKGFANEFRVAFLLQTKAHGAWPIPMP